MKSISLAICVTALPAMAHAQIIEEARVGVLAHNICVTDCKNAGKEDGPNVEGELVFASPDALSFAFSPRPFIVGSANTTGATSFAGAGLMWNFEFARGWAFEPSLSYVIHDGEIESPFPQGSPESEAFAQDNVFLGSRDLFRTGLAINRDFGESWGGQLIFEHLSHGQILGNGRNQGMDSAGVRIYYRFGG